ncbi:hypothetical protein ID866_11781 [Astraeus odoratus]|nr:hypothetical protein ID866_11781 [Astraeus odoratus]
MKLIFSQRNNNIYLFSFGLSCRKIASKTGLRKSIVGEVLYRIQPEKPRIYGGHPSKLNSTNEWSTVQQIITVTLCVLPHDSEAF